jgi:transcriptional regulator with XRE-family HTH domain
MFCPTCNAEMGKTTGRYQFRECGLDNVWLVNWPMLVCADGHTRVPVLPDAAVLTRAIARELVRIPGALEPDMILFLRESLGLKGHELAMVLGVTRIQVSRWENARSIIGAYQDLKLRLEVIDRMLPLASRREAREEVLMMFQRNYRAEEVLEDQTVNVPPTLELMEA